MKFFKNMSGMYIYSTRKLNKTFFHSGLVNNHCWLLCMWLKFESQLGENMTLAV